MHNNIIMILTFLPSTSYISVAVGKNILSKMLKTMCEEAGVTGHKTMQSLFESVCSN